MRMAYLQSRNYLRLFKQDDRQQAILHLQSRNYLRLFKPKKREKNENKSTK